VVSAKNRRDLEISVLLDCEEKVKGVHLKAKQAGIPTEKYWRI
jgi:hypothetical protein